MMSLVWEILEKNNKILSFFSQEIKTKFDLVGGCYSPREQNFGWNQKKIDQTHCHQQSAVSKFSCFPLLNNYLFINTSCMS